MATRHVSNLHTIRLNLSVLYLTLMMLRVPADFHDDSTRAIFPRQLIIYDEKSNDWSSCVDARILANTEYLAVSYCQKDFPDKLLFENTVRITCQILNLRAYWLDFACIGLTPEERNSDLYRIADVFRGAKKTVIIVDGEDDSPLSQGWLNWGNQIWTLPEALLSQELFYKVGTRFVKSINLRRLANLAYKDRHDEMMLIDGYSGKDPLPLKERIELLWKAIRKRSSRTSQSNGSNASSKNAGYFTSYAAERVYALMGFMQYRVVPDLNESEEVAFIRLMQANKLGGETFSWGLVVPLSVAVDRSVVSNEVNDSSLSSSREPSVTTISAQNVGLLREDDIRPNCYERHNTLVPSHRFQIELDMTPSDRSVTVLLGITPSCIDEAKSVVKDFLSWIGDDKPLNEKEERMNPLYYPKSNMASANYVHSLQAFEEFYKSKSERDLNSVLIYLKNSVGMVNPKDTHVVRYHIEYACALVMRYGMKQNFNDLNQAIIMANQVLKMKNNDVPSFYEHFLLVLYFLHFWATNNIESLRTAIRFGEQAIRHVPEHDLEKRRYQFNLATVHRTLFLRTGDVEILNQGLSYALESLDTEMNRKERRALHYAMIASMMKCRYDCSKDIADLDQAIIYGEEATDLARSDNSGLTKVNGALYLYNLSSMLCQRYKVTGSIHHLNEAVTTLESAFPLIMRGVKTSKEEEKSICFAYLAAILKARYDRLGDLNDLDRSIAYQEDSIRLTDSTSSGASGRNENANLSVLELQNAMLSMGSSIDGMDQETLKNLSQLLSSSGSNKTSPVKPLYLHILAIALFIRYKETGNINDIDQAILNSQDSIKSSLDSHADKPCTYNHLGFMLLARFGHSRDLEDLDKAVSNRQEAVKLIGDRHPQKPIYMDNLGLTLSYRFVQTGRLNRLDIDRAVASHTEALRRVGQAGADSLAEGEEDMTRSKLRYLTNLARALEIRFDKFRERKDLEDAIARRKSAVELQQGRISESEDDVNTSELFRTMEKLKAQFHDA